MRAELIKLREENGMTQEQVAESVGVSRSFYGHIETGTRNPSYGLARRISELFNTSIESIFFEVECFRMKQTNLIKDSATIHRLG